MTMDITKSVAFTGHRSERILQVRMLYLYLDIVSQVKRLYSLGYRYFLSGCLCKALHNMPYVH